MLDTIFGWLYERKTLQALFIAIITSLPFFYFVDDNTNLQDVLVGHWYGKNGYPNVNRILTCLLLGFFLVTLTFNMAKSCIDDAEPPTMYFLGLSGVCAFFTFVSEPSLYAANYLLCVLTIISGFLLANWEANNKNEKIKKIIGKTIYISCKIFGWIFFILWLSLMGYLIYDWIN